VTITTCHCCKSNTDIERQELEALCGWFLYKAKWAEPEGTLFFTQLVSSKEVYDNRIVHDGASESKRRTIFGSCMAE